MDQLNFTLSLDNDIANKLKPLAPHKSTFDLNEPRKVSQNLSMPKTVIGTLSNWIGSKDNDVDLVKLQKMESLYID